MEVLLEVRNHAFARVAVRAEERVVVADRVQALAYLLLREVTLRVLARERLDGTLFTLDVLLDISP